MISVQNLSMTFGTRELFRGISFGIDPKERVGLIGPNGSGKSTLLKIIAGLEKASSGSVSFQRGLRIGYLAQVPVFKSGATILSTLLESARDDEDWDTIALAHEWISKLELNRFANAEDKLVDELSGGWKKRVALARELVKNPDVLLMDEPTNHLDIESILWLETFLAKAPFASLTITHDRQFLQNVSNRILELDRRNPNGLLSIQGNYAAYVEAKDLLIASQQRHESVLSNKLRRETEWLRRGAKARQTKQQGRIQRAEELKDQVQDLKSRNHQRSLNLDFQSVERNPKRLIEAKGISKSFSTGTLFQDLDLFIGPSTRLGLIGENGCGKSTLIRILLGTESPDSGKVIRAEDLKVAYFEQNRETLDPSKNLIQTLVDMGEYVDFGGRKVHVRGYLERFLFASQQMEQPVGKLSGGEQSRLLLARLMLTEAQVLVLDEPTNDLDLETLEILQDCLAEFNGAVILVTHDRYFMGQVANQILAFPPRSALTSTPLVKFADLEQWEAWHEELPRGNETRLDDSPKSKSESSPEPKSRMSFKEKRELETIEQEVEKAEQELQSITQLIESPDSHSNPLKMKELTQQLNEKQLVVDRLYQRWNELEKRKQSVE